MRRLGHRAQGAEQARKAGHETAKREPLAEGIRKGLFSSEETETIARMRSSLIKEGLTDTEIAKAVSERLQRTALSLIGKIRSMLASGELPKNPNRRSQIDFSPEELALISQKRAELIKMGRTDKYLSKPISKALRRSRESVYQKICKLVKKGDLPANPNKQSEFTPEDLKIISQRRAELIRLGKSDIFIANSLRAELGRSGRSIREKIRNLVYSGKLPPNPGHVSHVPFTPYDIALLRQRRAGLMAMGQTDAQISRSLSKDLQRNAGSIQGRIIKMVKSGELPENPNRRAKFAPADLSAIAKRRAALIAQGLTDKEISRAIAKKTRYPAHSIYAKLFAMVDSGALEQNPNKKNKSPFTRAELDAIAERREALMAVGQTDTEISRSLSKDLQRSAGSITAKICVLVTSGLLCPNPNKNEQSKFTPSDLAAILRRRAELAALGHTDGAISHVLSKEIDWPAKSIYQKIYKMVKSGELPENPNKRGTKPPEAEVLAQLKEAVFLYTEVSE